MLITCDKEPQPDLDRLTDACAAVCTINTRERNMPKPKKPGPAVEMIGALRDVVERYAKDDDGLDVSIALAFVLANQVARFEHTETRNAFIDRFMEQLRYWLEETLGVDLDIKPEKPPLRLIDGGKEDPLA
jgi:hypothetical protein